MNAETGLPETLMEAVNFFSAGDNAFEFLKQLRWPDGVSCPTCGSSSVSFLSTRKMWECKTAHPKRQFSVKVGTIFEDSPIKLEKWFMAIWLVTNCKNGVSSYEIHREIGVTQKTGWFMLHRIRLALEAGTFMKTKFTGIVESDETFVGGLSKNMHKVERAKKIKGTGGANKTAVHGLLQRKTDGQHSRVMACVAPNVRRESLIGTIKANVEAGSEIHTDKWCGYNHMPEEYAHKAVDHAIEYVRDNVHTNGLENFWSLLKRAIKGTYVNVEPAHLFRYVSEQVFRFNQRKDDNHGRFLSVMGKVFGRRITYKQLIESEMHGLPCQA